MSGLHGLALCALVALSPVLLASDDHTPPGRSSVDPDTVSGSHAVFTWADYDGDGSLDLAAVNELGKLQLLQNIGEGRFEDVTERAGLAGIENAALVLWADYDSDGSLDLFVGASEGASMLLHNDRENGGLFSEVSQTSGLLCEGAVRQAHWLDHDGDGRLDLHVVTLEKNLLFQGKEGSLFERTELPLSAETLPPLIDAYWTREQKDPSEGAPAGDGNTAGGFGADRANDVGGGTDRVPARNGAAVSPPVISVPNGGPREPVLICATEIKDQAMPSSCIQASSTPTLGLLYPISANLFVAVSGDVGIGTTSPTARLHVAGTARVTDTLTLAPAGDQALNVSTGSIYKGGSLFIHTKGGLQNTAVGTAALELNTGGGNTAAGYFALRNNGGLANTATGAGALYSNTTGAFNTANGSSALRSNTTGSQNTASGLSALYSNTTGQYNTASGSLALRSNTTGSRNTASGKDALGLNVSGSYNTATGYRALFFSNSGSENTAHGASALRNCSSGNSNTAHGAKALRFNTSGSFNTATGRSALYSNSTGFYNTATGINSLSVNTGGDRNTTHGAESLRSNTAGNDNTASGFMALRDNTGSRNIAVGKDAGLNLTTGNDNIAIGHAGVAGESSTIRIGTAGTQTRAFIAGIHGVTTGHAASTVGALIDMNGQLGTVVSSRRFKKNIADMGDATERLLDLRPVVFHYKQEQEVERGEVPFEYGLIAEEVAEIFPDLVVYDEEGKPFTVKYHILSSMLLNELKKLSEHSERLDARDEEQTREIEDLRSMVLALKAQVESKADIVASR